MSVSGDSQAVQELVEGAQVDFAPESLNLFGADECGEGMSPSSRAKDEEAALRMVIGNRIARARKALGLKEIDLQRRLGHANLTMISLFENGHRSPSLKNLQILADALEVTTDYLLGRTDDLGLMPEDGNQALIKGVLTSVLTHYNQKYIEGLAANTAVAIEGASMDRVLLNQVADTAVELKQALTVINKHHGEQFESLRGGSKLVRLIDELYLSVDARIKRKQHETALMQIEHPVLTVQEVSTAVQHALFG